MYIPGVALPYMAVFVDVNAENEVRCAICGDLLLLTESVADEEGKPAHSECYINKIAEVLGSCARQTFHAVSSEASRIIL